MDLKKHFSILINRLEYRITKDLEQTLDGVGETCFLVIYNRLAICIRARKEIDLQPCRSVAELLERHAYSDRFIKGFLNKINLDAAEVFEDDEIESLRHRLIQLIFIQENYITRLIERNLICAPEQYFVSFYNQLEECMEARKAVNFLPAQSVEELLKNIGYGDSFINEFINKVNLEKQQEF